MSSNRGQVGELLRSPRQAGLSLPEEDGPRGCEGVEVSLPHVQASRRDFAAKRATYHRGGHRGRGREERHGTRVQLRGEIEELAKENKGGRGGEEGGGPRAPPHLGPSMLIHFALSFFFVVHFGVWGPYYDRLGRCGAGKTVI